MGEKHDHRVESVSEQHGQWIDECEGKGGSRFDLQLSGVNWICRIYSFHSHYLTT